ncbi:MAG: CPBP family intramembrane metalloprotease [Asticcacaulis sp.]|uniref:CPBP family intramembrane glutamic endopeptidase n=1 Tax=Asticcacaulis sp. TaxID=1872648 RepID=UPI0025BC7B9D|nr:CPBP family intramembrane glutamic endopeptidase [Asticcacaulis sp.]MCA1936906.1 CPBP family intramembrane metalloprotease [Asticcacaulis sp.]
MAKDMGSVGARLMALVQITAAIAALFVTSGLIGGLITPNLPENLRTPILGLALWGGVLAGALMLMAAKTSYGLIGFSLPPNWSKCLLWVAIAVIACLVGAIAIGECIHRLTDWPPLDVSYIRTSIKGDVIAYAIWIVLVVWGSAAFGEELLARGFILNRMEAVFGRSPVGIALAVLGQAAIFGALHAIQGTTGVVITAYIGIVLAGTYYLSGRNLWAPILAHGLMDTVSLTTMYLGAPLPGYLS